MGTWTRDDNLLTDFDSFTSSSYIAIEGVPKNAVNVIFCNVRYIPGDEIAFITEELSENETLDKLKRLEACGGIVKSRIRVFK